MIEDRHLLCIFKGITILENMLNSCPQIPALPFSFFGHDQIT